MGYKVLISRKKNNGSGKTLDLSLGYPFFWHKSVVFVV